MSDSDEEEDSSAHATFSFMSKYGKALSGNKTLPVVREALFDGGLSDFTLIGSIFKIIGTPDLQTWPVRFLPVPRCVTIYDFGTDTANCDSM